MTTATTQSIVGLRVRSKASEILSNYKQPKKIEYTNGMYRNYEDYVANSNGSPMSRENFLKTQQEKANQSANQQHNEDRQSSLVSNTGTSGTYYNGSTGGSLSSYGNATQSLLEQQKQARLNTAQTGLQATRENVLANLATKKAEIDPRIAQSRASAVSGTAIAQKRLADLIPFAGTMAGTQVARGEQLNTDLQNRQSELDVQREQSFKDISTQETEAERAYQQGLALAQSQAQEQYLTEQLQNARTQEERAYAQQLLNDQRAYTERLTADERSYQAQLQQQQLAQQQQQLQEQRAYQEQQAEKQQQREDYIATINQYQKDYTAEINKLTAQGVPDTDYRMMALKSERAKKVANLEEAKQNAYIQSLKDEQDKQEQALELAKWRFDNGLPATQMDAQLLGVPVGQVSPAQAIKNAELALAKQKKASGSSSGSKLTYNQALSQARQILGSGASAQSVVNLASQLQSGNTSGLSNYENIPQSKINSATDALKYLTSLKSAGDLVSINAFIHNNQSEIDRIASDFNETAANRKAADQIQKLYYKYK